MNVSYKEKACKTCKVVKPLTEFYKNNRNKDGHITACKPCETTRARKWGDKNPDRKLKAARAWVKANPLKVRAISKRWAEKNPEAFSMQYLRTYSLTLAQYKEMYDLQAGKCAICITVPSEGQKLFVDHSHTTGKVRGLLCRFCNTALGFMKDDSHILKNAIKYLNK